MPVYCYKCLDCLKGFEVRHSMSFEDQKCVHCSSNQVFKVPSLCTQKPKKTKSAKPGKIVDNYIQDAKKEIEKEKTKLRSEEM